MKFRITDPRIERTAGGLLELSADLAGTRLWFRVPESSPAVLRGEPFVLAAILPAMIRNTPLELSPDLPLSAEFLAGLREWAGIVRLWPRTIRHPAAQVPIEAAVLPEPDGKEVGSFFSGGVDGTWTFLHADRPISQAIFVHGIDFQLDNPMAGEAVHRNRAWLAARDTPLLEVSSNIRWVGHAFGLGWNAWNGAGLAAIAHVLGLRTTLIASGHHWREYFLSGSHPLTDPLLGSARREIVHHGAGMLRWQKLEAIAEEPGVIDLLRVCWQDRDWNCGRCEKCQRTMLLLYLLGIRSDAFPTVQRLADIHIDIPRDLESRADLAQALELARRQGHRAAERVIGRRLRGWDWRRIAQEADDGFLAGRVQRWRQRRAARLARPA